MRVTLIWMMILSCCFSFIISLHIDFELIVKPIKKGHAGGHTCRGWSTHQNLKEKKMHLPSSNSVRQGCTDNPDPANFHI